jgi:hypothetical protein
LVSLGDHHFPLHLRISNENGSTTPTFSPEDLVAIHPGSLDAVPLVRYPRRGKWLYLDFIKAPKLPNGSYSQVARIVVPNPTPQAFPQWQPKPLPQAVRAGDVTFLLKRFRVGVPLPEQWNPWQERDVPATALQFEARSQNALASRWQPLSIDFSNATGDRWDDHRWNVSSEAGAFWLPASLGREENAWKVDVRFGQTRGFTQDEKWVFRDLPLPPVMEGKNVNRWLVRGEQRIWLRALTVSPLTKGKRYLSGLYQLVPSVGDGLLTVTDLRDEQGRPIPVQVPYSQRQGLTTPISTDLDNFFSLAIPADIRRLNLSIVLHRSRKATFLAAPEAETGTP